MCTGSPTSRCPTGQLYKGDRLTTKVTNSHPSIAGPSNNGHERVEHDVYKCTKCGSLFNGKKKVLYHIRSKHKGRGVACALCQCTFVTNAGLHEHVRHIHEKLARYQCETCGKGYASRSNYEDHLAAHRAVKPHVCTLCNRRFTLQRGLNAHVTHFHSEDG